ncbi:MAG: EAL domain-containing protein [Oscillospiraceae bacterium]|nr:EAL domain-containing protein [Oscillospiraceae bacterium]
MLKTILIVDDQQINRRILQKILCDQYKILEAENGKEALAILKQPSARISAVLLDLIMPVMDGYGVLEAMRKSPDLSSIPVIVASQTDKSETEGRALELGARDFIPKPYHPVVLRKRLANLIELYESNVCIIRIERDTLTGLFTRDAFYRRATQILEDDPSGCYHLVITDIERFKLVNDRFGTTEGDKLLRFIGSRLSEAAVQAGGICARLNADHFAALVPKAALDEDGLRCLITQAERDLALYPLNMKISLKFGIYPVTNRDVSVDLMCDRAMLAAETLKGQYKCASAFYDDSLRQKLLQEQEITNSMAQALAEGQFQVYLQPKYDLSSDRIAGAEALVRWEHPKLGNMNPGAFIPLFERNGFITELDSYVWDKTCEIMESWIHLGQKYVPVSVNVSRKDIYQANLPGILSGIVAKHGLQPSQLHLEITETAYTENPEQLIEVVRTLKNLGFPIEMDDFGSGYSSLNMLSELPIDILKLDMRFIQKENQRENRRNITSFIISLAKWMDLLVVAEGVETQEQIDMLRNMDCNYVQGYYYAKPMRAADFTALLLDAALADPVSANRLHLESEVIHVSERAGKKCMLIVDDMELNRAILTQCFQDDFTIVEAADGLAAYRYIEDHFDEIAVILLDLIMPVMDGFALLKKLQANPLFSTIPVIVSSQPGEASERQAFELGASDFLPKPFSPDIAVHRVQNVLARSTVQILEREKRMLSKMKQLALEAKLDQLTGLYNRMELERQVQASFNHDPNLNAIFYMLDIDNFKSINDHYGHEYGDDAIRSVAERLQALFREDDLVCRMGGDEFAVFVRAKLSTSQIAQRLERIRESLHFQLGEMEITCSIGASIAPQFGKDYQTLYHNADMSLLTAKRLGKNRYQIYGGEMDLPDQVLYRNMDWLLDESSDAILVCDAESYRLHYLNAVACSMANMDKALCLSKPCYEALWGRSSPCPHCVPIDRLPLEYTEHEVFSEETGRSYLIKEKRIIWGSRPARIQYIMDNTVRANLNLQLKSILNTVPGALCLYQWDGHGLVTLQTSDQLTRIIGASTDTAYQNSYNLAADFVHPDDVQIARESMQKLLQTHAPIDCIYRVMHLTKKQYIWLRMQAAAKAQPDGTLLIYALYTDITELHHVRVQLQEQRDMLAAAMEHSGMRSWVYDFSIPGISMTWRAPAATRLPEPLPEQASMLQALQNGQTHVTRDVPVTTPESGEARWLRIRYTLISKDAAGAPAKAIGTALDITEQKRAEQRFLEEAAYLNALSSSLVSSFRVNVTTGAVEEAHSFFHMIDDPKAVCFNDASFRAVCTYLIPLEAERERCIAAFCATQLKQDYAKGHLEKSLEFPACVPGTKPTWFSLKVKLMPKPDTEELIAFFSFWDIGAEKALQQVLDRLLQTEYDSICLLDAETGKPEILHGHKLHAVVAAQEQLHDISAGLAQYIHQRCRPEDAAQTVEKLSLSTVRRALAQQELYTVNYQAITPAGLHSMRANYRYLDLARTTILCSVQDRTKLQEN